MAKTVASFLTSKCIVGKIKQNAKKFNAAEYLNLLQTLKIVQNRNE